MSTRTRRLAVVIAIAALATSCGVSGQGNAHEIADDALPGGLVPDRSPTTTTTVGIASEPVRLYFVRDKHLVQLTSEVAAPAELKALVDALVSGPPATDTTGLRTALSSEAVVRSVTLTRGRVRIDLTPTFEALPPSDQILALGQLVLTLTARPGVGQAEFTLDGDPIDVPRGNGLLVSGSLVREDYVKLLLPA